MLVLAGAFLVALGLLSGAILLVAPFGLIPAYPDATLWVMFPLLSVVGYSLFLMQAREGLVRTFTLAASAILLLMALASVAALVLSAAGLVDEPTSTAALWFVMVVGFLLGSTGAAAFGRRQADA